MVSEGSCRTIDGKLNEGPLLPFCTKYSYLNGSWKPPDPQTETRFALWGPRLFFFWLYGMLGTYNVRVPSSRASCEQQFDKVPGCGMYTTGVMVRHVIFREPILYLFGGGWLMMGFGSSKNTDLSL